MMIELVDRDILKFSIIIFVLFLLSVTSACISDADPRMFSSSSRYSITIRSTEPLENVTFIVPLPVKNGVPLIGEKILHEGDFVQPGVEILFTRSPQGLDAATKSGEIPCFVVVSAERLIPSEPGASVYSITIEDRILPDRTNGFRNTLTPFGNESLIVPKRNFSFRIPELTQVSELTEIYSPQNIHQDTPVYADFTTSHDARVDIFVENRIRNEWKQGYDSWFGNTLSEYFSANLISSHHGWFAAEGDFALLDGYYPNFNNPEWRNAFNRSDTG